MDSRSERPLSWFPVAMAVAIALVIAISSCAPGGAEVDPAPTPEPISTELALQTFDSAWSRINDVYYDPDFRGIDWPAIRDELRPSAARVTTKAELRRILTDMLSRLGESHFAIIPGEAVDAISVESDGTTDAATSGLGEVGLDARWVGDDLTVFRVGEGSAADAGVRPGWAIDRIGDRDIAEWREIRADSEPGRARISIETETVQGAGALLDGGVGTVVEVAFRDDGDAERVLELERRPLRGQIVQLGQLPPMVSALDYRRVDQPQGCVGVVEFNVWMVPLVMPFNEAIDELSDCAGIVIDIRGNPGGVGGMVMSMAGSFFGERSDLGTIVSRSGELSFVAMPRNVDTSGQLREPFEGRVAVLIDQMSMSTSEIFAAGLKSTGRARLYGQTTPGYALPAVTLPLPSGDVLYHVVSNLTDPEGQRIEGLGVEPDVAIPLDRAALLEGRDEALDAAIAWVAGTGD